MIVEKAQVVALDGEYAWVEAQRRSTCDSCSAQKGCGTSVLSKVLGRRVTQVRALNTPQANIGDSVTIAIAENTLLSSALLVYISPLLLIVLLCGLGQVVLGERFTEVWAIFLGFSGLVISLTVIRHLAANFGSKLNYHPVVLEIESLK